MYILNILYLVYYNRLKPSANLDDKVFRGILLQQINQVELLSPLISKDIFLHKFYVKNVPNTLKKYLNTEKHSILIRCKK